MFKLSEKCDYIPYSTALFSNYELTSSSGKRLEEINHAHIASLMYKLLTSGEDCKDSDELCNRLKLLLQKNYAGNNSDLINQEIVAIVDKLLKYKCISRKQHKQILIKYNLV